MRRLVDKWHEALVLSTPSPSPAPSADVAADVAADAAAAAAAGPPQA